MRPTEPVMYVNGRPYVVRSVNAPYENLAHTGITVSRVEDMEVRLKEDIRQEIAVPEHCKVNYTLQFHSNETT